jgi:hypothetical protein
MNKQYNLAIGRRLCGLQGVLTIERTVHHQQLSGIYTAVIAFPDALLPVVIASREY